MKSVQTATVRDGAVVVGNAAEDHTLDRGWFVGGFTPVGDNVYPSNGVEVKYGQHGAGDERAEWVARGQKTTVCTLVSGEIDIIFHDQVVTLKKPGDYVIWGPGAEHRWRARKNTACITVRWSSS